MCRKGWWALCLGLLCCCLAGAARAADFGIIPAGGHDNTAAPGRLDITAPGTYTFFAGNAYTGITHINVLSAGVTLDFQVNIALAGDAADPTLASAAPLTLTGNRTLSLQCAGPGNPSATIQVNGVLTLSGGLMVRAANTGGNVLSLGAGFLELLDDARMTLTASGAAAIADDNQLVLMNGRGVRLTVTEAGSNRYNIQRDPGISTAFTTSGRVLVTGMLTDTAITVQHRDAVSPYTIGLVAIVPTATPAASIDVPPTGDYSPMPLLCGLLALALLGYGLFRRRAGWL